MMGFWEWAAVWFLGGVLCTFLTWWLDEDTQYPLFALICLALIAPLGMLTAIIAVIIRLCGVRVPSRRELQSQWQERRMMEEWSEARRKRETEVIPATGSGCREERKG